MPQETPNSLNCRMKRRFEELRDSSNPLTLETLHKKQLAILNALVDYKGAGCKRDQEKCTKTSNSFSYAFNHPTQSRSRSKRSRSRKQRSRSHKQRSRSKRARSRKQSKRARSRKQRSRTKRSRTKRSKGSRGRSRTVRDVLDRKILLSETPSDVKKKLSVTLKKNKYAGTGLFATKEIKKGRTIAYYKMKVHQDNNKKSYKSPTKCMYCFSIYTKKERLSRSLMGDLDKESAPLPKNNIPYWAYFSNEPSGKQTENSEIDIAIKDNYKKRQKLKAGDFITYKLKATRNIKPGEEIVWCYGEAYGRDYKTNCGYQGEV